MLAFCEFVSVLLPFQSTVRNWISRWNNDERMRQIVNRLRDHEGTTFSAHIMLMHFNDAATAAVNIIISLFFCLVGELNMFQVIDFPCTYYVLILNFIYVPNPYVKRLHHRLDYCCYIYRRVKKTWLGSKLVN